ncbi:MAG: hypothetical protein ASARMPREDX12_005912 [Alectoria sarmentosa]|nr:MAG: hypothetical protein ASARMPREDX12_005912 [Alectoria sarmentosa]
MEIELADIHTPPGNSPTSSSQRKFPKDEAVLARFGKRQQLQRGFGLLSVIGLTSTLMITWEAITSTLLNGLQNGGPAGLIYGYIFVWCGASLQALVMAEMASMIPLAGGPFNWVAILSPPWCKKFLSYLAGWLTVITWQAFVAGTTYVTGTLVQGLLILNYPSYDYQRWHGTLLFYAVLAFALFVNTYLGRLLPQFEPMMLLFHVMGFFGILITLVYLAPHQPAKEVFTTFLNLGDWSTTTLSFFVGLITAMNSFPGLDAADHIAEEIQNAPRVIPLSIGISTLLNGSMGFAMLIALLFCMPNDIQSVMNSETYYPFMSIYTYAVGSTSGATALVDQRTHLPLYAIGITTIINLLLALINIGSSVGFDAFISLAVASYYSSFILSASVMLNKRLTTPNSDLPWGPFRLGRAGVPVTVVAIAYSVLGAFFSMWPTAVKPSAESMNYCVVVFGGAMVFSLLFWLAYGRKHYTGPVLELRN